MPIPAFSATRSTPPKQSLRQVRSCRFQILLTGLWIAFVCAGFDQSWAAGPEIVITGNSVEISNGDTTASLADHTDFGSVIAAGNDTIVRTFTIQNTGTEPLVLGTLVRSGTHRTNFTAIQQPISPVAAGGSTTFQISFNPSAPGLRTATLALGSNDADEPSFSFAIQGTGGNSAPTFVGCNRWVWEGYGSDMVGELYSSDPDSNSGEGYTYSLVSGPGDTDNASFHINNTGPYDSFLKLNAVADYERQSSYSLRVRVTDGGSPPLSFENSLQITIQDTNEAAVSLAEQAYLKASNPDVDDGFGKSVAVWGNTLAVGAPSEGGSGAVYIFTRSAGTWTQQALLKAGNSDTNDLFGTSVAIWGDTIVIGAPFEDTKGTGANSPPNEDAPNSGAVYVFTRNAGTWTQQACLKPSNGIPYDEFGRSVAVWEDTVVVGTPKEDSNTTGVNSTRDASTLSARAYSSGAAHVFVRHLGEWTEQAYLKGSNTDEDDRFGQSVAITEDCVVIGAPGEDSPTTGVNSTPDNHEPRSGAAYVFARQAGTWTQQAYLKASNTGRNHAFGQSVAVSGDTVVVGAYRENGIGAGVNSIPSSYDPVLEKGAAYVFVRDAAIWTQQAYLKSSNPSDGGSEFGGSVAISGDTVIIGAAHDPYGVKGVNQWPWSLGTTWDSGAAFVFFRSQGIWTQQAYLKSSLPEQDALFGCSVALHGDTALVGMSMEAAQTFSLSAIQEISVYGNDVDILHGDLAPSFGDHTDFGKVFTPGGSRTRTFTVRNTGTTPLTLGGITITGPHANDFSVSAPPPEMVVPAGSVTFQVTFDPAATGLRSATLSLANGDTDENPFTFSIQGSGTDHQITVSGNGVNIARDDTVPSLDDHTDHGAVIVGKDSRVRTFTVHCTGTTPLALDAVTLQGEGAGAFIITLQPPASIAPSGSATFQITFIPPAAGVYDATVSIGNDAGDHAPFTFAIRGYGIAAVPQAQTITFNPPPTLYANQSPVSLSAKASSGLPVTFSIISGPATLEGNLLTLGGPGTVKISATQTGNDHYKPAPVVTKTIKVNGEPATAQLVDLVHVYDGTPHAARVLGGTGEIVITYTLGKTTTTTPPVNAGTYAVKTTVGGRTLTGKLIIAKVPLEVIPDSHRRFIGQNNAPLTIRYAGFVGDDTESSAFALPGARRPSVTTTAKASSPGGAYPIQASGAVLANYIPVYVSGTLLVETFAGMYEAMLEDESGHLAGKVEFTVAASSTTLSGRLTVPGEAAPLSFTGALSVDPANEKATGASKPVTKSGRTYALTFELPFGAGFESELHINSTLTAQTTEGMKVWAPAKSQQNLFTGAHTLILAPALPAGPEVPAGYGHATAVIDSRATLKIVGRLGDGTTLTTTLMPDIQLGYRLFALPYGRSGSYIAGWLDFEAHPLLTTRVHVPASAGCDLVWAKDGQTKDKSYRDDFGPVLTRVTVDPWIVPTKTTTLTSLLGLSPSTPFDVAHSGIESAAFSNLPAELTLTATNKLLVTQTTNSTRWSATVTPATGAFAGSFELLDAGKKRVVPFTGVLRQPHGTTSGPLGAGHALVPALPSDLTHGTISGAIRFDHSDD